MEKSWTMKQTDPIHIFLSVAVVELQGGTEEIFFVKTWISL